MRRLVLAAVALVATLGALAFVSLDHDVGSNRAEARFVRPPVVRPMPVRPGPGTSVTRPARPPDPARVDPVVSTLGQLERARSAPDAASRVPVLERRLGNLLRRDLRRSLRSLGPEKREEVHREVRYVLWAQAIEGWGPRPDLLPANLSAAVGPRVMRLFADVEARGPPGAAFYDALLG